MVAVNVGEGVAVKAGLGGSSAGGGADFDAKPTTMVCSHPDGYVDDGAFRVGGLDGRGTVLDIEVPHILMRIPAHVGQSVALPAVAARSHPFCTRRSWEHEDAGAGVEEESMSMAGGGCDQQKKQGQEGDKPPHRKAQSNYPEVIPDSSED